MTQDTRDIGQSTIEHHKGVDISRFQGIINQYSLILGSVQSPRRGMAISHDKPPFYTQNNATAHAMLFPRMNEYTKKETKKRNSVSPAMI
jgi:hypothetical protein